MIDVSSRLAMGIFVDLRSQAWFHRLPTPLQHKVEPLPLPLSHCRELEPELQAVPSSDVIFRDSAKARR